MAPASLLPVRESERVVLMLLRASPSSLAARPSPRQRRRCSRRAAPPAAAAMADGGADAVWASLTEVERTGLHVALMRWDGARAHGWYDDPLGGAVVAACIPAAEQAAIRAWAASSTMAHLVAVRTAELDAQLAAAAWGEQAGGPQAAHPGPTQEQPQEQPQGQQQGQLPAVRQLVILGAGSDTRAWRLRWPPGFAVFEVDSPAVLGLKRRCARRAEVVADAGEPEELWARLLAAGLDAGAPTAWLMEGFIGYLTRDAGSALLAALARRSAPGSRLLATAPPSAAHRAEADGAAGSAGPRLRHSTFEEAEETLARVAAAGWDVRLLTSAALGAKYGVSGAQAILGRDALMTAIKAAASLAELRQLVEQHLHSPEMKRQHLAAAASQLGQWARRGAVRTAGDQAAAQQLLRRVEEQLLQPRILDACRCRQLSNVVWAAGVCGYRGPLLTACLARLLAPEQLRGANAQDLANAAYGAATAGVALQSGDVRRLVAAFAAQLPAASPQAVSNTLWAVAVLSEAPAEELEQLRPQLEELLAALARHAALLPQDVSNALLAAAKLGLAVPAAQLEQLAAALVRQLGAATPQAVANTLWACGQLRHLPSQLLAALTRQPAQLGRLLAASKPQDLAIMALACAKLGHADERLLGPLLRRAAAQVHTGASWPEQELANTCWAVAVLDLRQCASELAVLARAASEQWGGGMAPESLCQLHQVQLWATDCGLQLPGGAGAPGLAGALAPQQLEACRTAWAASLAARQEQQPTSQLQREVFAALQRLPLEWAVPPAMEQLAAPDGACLVDIAATTAGGARLAVEADGPVHFRTPDAAQTGDTLFRNRALAARGYSLVVVPWFEWAELRGAAERQRWLEARVDGALRGRPPGGRPEEPPPARKRARRTPSGGGERQAAAAGAAAPRVASPVAGAGGRTRHLPSAPHARQLRMCVRRMRAPPLPLLLSLLLLLRAARAQEGAACDWSAPAAPEAMAALVLGGSGAVGHHIVQQLLASDQWSKVITVGRREVPLPAGAPGAAKLTQVVVDMDRLEAEAGRHFAGVDAVFCALGTTRGDAGSAEVFRRVDHDYVLAGAKAAKAAGVPYFGLVSAQGANPSLPGSDLRLLHPLLYSRTKGLAEEGVKAQGFSRAAIFRPGMLDRGDRARSIEKVFAPLLGSIPVAHVARAMLSDADVFRRGAASGATAVFEMRELRRMGTPAA
ncbi:HTATIP2 [Scenedesmus sp. PABB004]|nr:HTATIP2 [Scenedesmus sp. PABB004]